MQSFDKIYVGEKAGPLAIGKFKLSEAGVGWKSSSSGEIVTVPSAEIMRVSWLRVARDYRLAIMKKNGQTLKFDGFPKESREDLSSCCKQWFQVNLQEIEVSTRGYNWGEVDFDGNALSFHVHGKQAFEIPLNEVANTAVGAKAEVSLEFALGRGVRGGEDTLVEMRLYVPGGVTKGQIKDSDDKVIYKDKQDAAGEDGSVEESGMEVGEISQQPALDSNGEALSAANLLCETIKQKSDMGAMLSEMIVSFDELLCVTPRGRFQVDMHQDFFRLRGKSYDYRIMYTGVTKMFLVPRPDDMHWNFVVGVNPPLRQGQTKYPFLVFQFEREEEIELELNIEEEVLQTKYQGKLNKSYDGPTFQTISEIFHGLIGKKVIPASSTYRSSQGFHALKCSHKATEAIMYPLEKAFLILQKPPVYIAFSEIASITFSRVASAATTGTKFIEMKFSLTSGTEYSYSSIPREEHSYLEEYCRSKKLSVSSEIEDFKVSYAEGDGRRKTIADYQDDLMGSESEDEDFQVKGEVSDVDEEFDTDYSTEEEDENGNVIEKKKKRERESDSSGDSSEGEVVSESKPKKKSGSGPSSPKPKKKKKKEGPKRALTSFLYFSNAKRAEVKARNPEFSIGDVAKELGTLWKAASVEEKEPFEKMAAEDKLRYQRELEEFKKTGILPSASKASSSAASSSVAKPAKVKAEKESVGKKSELSKEFVVDSDEDDF